MRDLQSVLVKKYDLAEFGIKTKLKECYGDSNVLYVIKKCRKNEYTKEVVVADMISNINRLAFETKVEVVTMFNKIRSI